MSFEDEVKESVADILPPGYKMVVGIPMPPSTNPLKKGIIVSHLRRVCHGLNSCGGMLAKYADFIVEVAPNRVTLETIKPYVDRLLPIFRDALSNVEEQSLSRKTDQEILAPLAAELSATITLFQSIDSYTDEEEPNTEFLIELLYGFGDDAKILRDAYRAGGVPKAFDTVLETGKARGYELVNYEGDLMFSKNHSRPWPIPFVGDSLVSKRVSELLEEAPILRPNDGEGAGVQSSAD
jgi:hypothetical protein